MSSGIYRWFRPALFALPPETAHAAALVALRTLGALPGPAPWRGTADGLSLLGLNFPNRVGFAAGLDKDGVAVRGLARLGFGFVEVGTVTPRPQRGNPRPRLFRLVEDEALVNRMGFNSAGVAAVVANLSRARVRLGVPVGVNIGKNRTTPLHHAAHDFAACLTAVYDVADYVAVNVSSPNTRGLRDLQAPEQAGRLVTTLIAQRDTLARQRGACRPLLVKLAPDLAPADLETTARAVIGAGADGLILGNTTVARPACLQSAADREVGGLSGKPLRGMALRKVRQLRQCLGTKPVLIGVGGIGTADHVAAMLDAGANLVQAYTGLIYDGPNVARRRGIARPRSSRR